MSKMNGAAAAENTTKRFASFREIADFLWQNAERLRGAYKPNEYDKIILPLKGRGEAQFLKPSEFPQDGDPATDEWLTHWETVHGLLRILDARVESTAAGLVTKLDSTVETAHELAYRLYTIGDRKKRAAEALACNAL